MRKERTRSLRAWLMVFAMLVTLMTPQVGTLKSKAQTPMGVTYAVHVQTFGDSQGWVSDGTMAGTLGQAKRLEEIKIKLTGDEYAGGIRYKTHVQTFGWRDWSKDGAANGSRGYGKRLEAIEIELYGEVAQHYDVLYRVHCQTYGWMPWVKNGVMAGTSGQGKRLEGIEIKLVQKQSATPMQVRYRTHCQTYGWLDWSVDGASNGTTGEGKRLEGIEIMLSGNQYSGGIEYKTHVQTYGWENVMVSNGAMSGTSGKAKRLEAIQIQLYGEVAEYYDVYYRVHAQTYGWLGWVKNGASAGTSGLSKRLESIQICLVAKDGGTPSFVTGASGYVVGTTSTTYSSNDAYINRVIELVNIERKKVGVAPLSFNADLTKTANVRAKEIAVSFSHTRPDGSSCLTAFPSSVGQPQGENIAAGYMTPEDVVAEWMASEGHRRNILDARFKTIGVGYYKTNSAYRTYWAQSFGGSPR